MFSKAYYYCYECLEELEGKELIYDSVKHTSVCPICGKTNIQYYEEEKPEEKEYLEPIDAHFPYKKDTRRVL